MKRRTAAQDDDPNVHCMPRGAPRIWTDDYYKRIFQLPDRLVILTERNMQYRQIFTDLRALPADMNPTWNGYSTARWEATRWWCGRKGSRTACGSTRAATRWVTQEDDRADPEAQFRQARSRADDR